RLIELFRSKFGETIPLVRREHVRGFIERKPLWLMRNLGIETIRQQVWEMEEAAGNFYVAAARRTTDASIRKLLGDLAAAEQGHKLAADRLEAVHLGEGAKAEEGRQEQRRFVLTYVQPGLAGLMDGSVSTLAPIFAAAFATQSTHETFLVGLAASVGAGISMGFTEAASDDGKLTGRGSPIIRGFAAGIMTAIGGLGHTLPYLIGDFWTATTIAMGVVLVELWAIAFIQNRFMDTPFWRAVLLVVFGGSLVFAAGILIGSA
ncbi:MAG: ferritin family protein, partial [Cucumibacter sp.]